MKTDVRGNVQSDVREGHFASHLLNEPPVELAIKKREMEDWWDRRAGGWTPDKIAA